MRESGINFWKDSEAELIVECCKSFSKLYNKFCLTKWHLDSSNRLVTIDIRSNCAVIRGIF